MNVVKLLGSLVEYLEKAYAILERHWYSWSYDLRLYTQYQAGVEIRLFHR